MSKRIDANSLAMENIRQRKTRSTCMILLVALFSLIVYMGSMFSLSLSRGLESLSDRLGADVIVVPAGYKAEIESVLLKGEPSTFYLPANTIDKLKKFNEIGRSNIHYNSINDYTFKSKNIKNIGKCSCYCYICICVSDTSWNVRTS